MSILSADELDTLFTDKAMRTNVDTIFGRCGL
jgi:hypothetical protein